MKAKDKLKEPKKQRKLPSVRKPSGNTMKRKVK